MYPPVAVITRRTSFYVGFVRLILRSGAAVLIFTVPRRTPEASIGIILRMNLSQFHQLRTAIPVSASPGKDADLALVEGNLRSVLMDSGLFVDVEVEHTDDVDQLVIALCRFRPEYTEADVAAWLEHMWADRVRYPFWEAHAIRPYADQVEFRAASRHSDGGHYVTVHLVAQNARIPAQRGPSD
jgi:hypothetical protein